MAKIVLIGAGSGFGARFGTDIMANETLRDSTIALCDIHEGRLEAVREYLQAMADKHHLPTKIIAGRDRASLLDGADFVLTSISAGGGSYFGEPYKSEVLIPKKYGILQSVADSYSVGSTFRFLRTAPVQLAICHDMEKYCPDAWLLNQTNPMAALTTVHSKGSKIKNVGLCHGVVNTAQEISVALGIPWEDIAYKVAGINHFAWFLELKNKKTGEDLYPLLDANLKKTDDPTIAEFLKREAVRVSLYREFGYFPTESTPHDSEYVPYYRRSFEVMADYGLSMREPQDGPYVRRLWEKDGAGNQVLGELTQSLEYNIPIMEAMQTDKPFRFNGNVINRGMITSFPDGVCVEVPCIADRHGVTPTVVGELPYQLAGLDRWHIAPIQLMVDAVLEQDRQKAFWAVAEDINVCAHLTLPQIHQMFDELWEAEGDLLRWYEDGTVVERCFE